MVLFIVKAAVAGLLVATVNLVAQRNPSVAGVIVAFPIITLLSIGSLVVDGARLESFDQLLVGILLGLASGTGFVVVVLLGIRATGSLALAMCFGAIAWIVVTVLLQRLEVAR